MSRVEAGAISRRLRCLKRRPNGAARAGGFSLHAGIDIAPHQRPKLERLCRYVSRPPVATGRMRRRLRRCIVLQRCYDAFAQGMHGVPRGDAVTEHPGAPRFICGAVMALLRAGAVISFLVIACVRPRLLAKAFLALWVSGAGPVIAAEPAEAGSEVGLDEIHVTAPKDRVRQRDGHIPSAYLIRTNNVFVRLQDEVGIRLSLVREQAEIVFRRPSVARQLPDAGSELARIHRRVPLEIKPDRLVTSGPSWVGDAGIVLAANVDDVDGLPAHIPFGPDVALVNLDHAVIRDSNFRTRLFVSNILHPRSRRCESELVLIDAWPEGTNPYVLLGASMRRRWRMFHRWRGCPNEPARAAH